MSLIAPLELLKMWLVNYLMNDFICLTMFKAKQFNNKKGKKHTSILKLLRGNLQGAPSENDSMAPLPI